MIKEICSLNTTDQPLWLFSEPAQTRPHGRLECDKQNAFFELLMTRSTSLQVVVSHFMPVPVACHPVQKGWV